MQFFQRLETHFTLMDFDNLESKLFKLTQTFTVANDYLSNFEP